MSKNSKNREYFAYKDGKRVKIKPDGSDISPEMTWGYYNSVSHHWRMQGPSTGKYPAKEDLEAITEEIFNPHMAKRSDPAQNPVPPTGITLQTDYGIEEGNVYFDMREPNTLIDDANVRRATIALAEFMEALYPSDPDEDEDDADDTSEGDDEDADDTNEGEGGSEDEAVDDDDEPTEPRYCDQTDEEREKDVDEMYLKYVAKFSSTP